jgi:hypothetical protein
MIGDFSCHRYLLFMNRDSVCAFNSSSFFSQETPLHNSARFDRLEACRLLVTWKADVGAATRCNGSSCACSSSLTLHVLQQRQNCAR